MKRILTIALISLFFAFFTGLQAQQVVASIGHYAENQQGSLSWTLGESFITTLNSESHFLTQGFHQGTLTLTTIFERHQHLLNIKVFPNPSQDMLFLEVKCENVGSWHYELVSIEGQSIIKTKVSGTTTEISLQAITAGVYLLRIFSSEELIKVVKIVKK